MPSFTSIKPAPDRDNFAFDFTKEIGSKGVLASVIWTCDNSIASVLIDPNAGDRILSVPVFDNYKTSALCGDMIDGVIYTLSVQGSISDGRIITLDADVPCSLEGVVTDPIMTVDQFRELFPSFSDETIYTDAMIQFWLTQVVVNPPIDEVRWGQFYNLGIMLWVAHNLMYMANAGKLASTGTMGPGMATSKSVNGVSVGYDLGFGQEMNAGWYGTTPYGNQFLYYLRLAGAGPIQF